MQPFVYTVGKQCLQVENAKLSEKLSCAVDPLCEGGVFCGGRCKQQAMELRAIVHLLCRRCVES